MANRKGPKDTAKDIRPADPAHRVEVGKEFAAAIAPDGPVEALHDAVEVPFKPDGKENRQGEYRELPPLHASPNGSPAQIHIPGNTDLDAPRIAGRHAEVNEPIAEDRIEDFFHARDWFYGR